MPRVFEGELAASAGRMAIVASRFNREIVDRLVAGALEGLRRHGVADDSIDLVWVPGAFELPLTAQRMAATGRYAGVICLGAIIRGETDHYEHIAREASAGIMQAGLTTDVPVLFGVLTCESEELALDRAGGKHGNKGYDAALAALEMANLRIS